MLLPDQTYDEHEPIFNVIQAKRKQLRQKTSLSNSSSNEEDDSHADCSTDESFRDTDEELSSATSNDVLRECEQFLHKHRMRNDFFCQLKKALSTKNFVPNEKKPKEQTVASKETSEEKTSISNSTQITEKPALCIQRIYNANNAIYTLPTYKRYKICNKLQTNTIGENFVKVAIIRHVDNRTIRSATH